jgi:hypothetical protein
MIKILIEHYQHKSYSVFVGATLTVALNIVTRVGQVLPLRQ